MKRLIPQPILSLVLLVTWVMLSNRVGPGEVLAGALFGLGIPRLTRAFWPGLRFVRPLLVAQYAGALLRDIAVANLEVALLVLGPKERMRPAFVRYPLELKNEFATIVLASTISLTPGTVTVDVDLEERVLVIHCLNAPDPAALVQRIRRKYETPLKEILP